MRSATAATPNALLAQSRVGRLGSRVRPALSIVLIRWFILVALATSTALLVDYWSYEVPFCAQAGCLAVRRYGYPAGIPMPLLGVGAFAVLYGITLIPSTSGFRRWAHSFSVVAGVAGLGLLAFQGLWVGSWCLPCVITDLCAVLMGVLGGIELWRGWPGKALAIPSELPDQEPPEQAPELLRLWGWIGLGLLAVAAPYVWPKLRSEPPVPPGILALYRPGKVNIVEFSDFQCPHCRALHPRLRNLVEDYKGEVNYIQLNTPMPRHTEARAAARRVICAEAQGLGNELADVFFASETLDEEEQRTLARSRRVDLDALDKCLAKPEADARVQSALDLLTSTGLVITPTTYVGSHRISGAQPDTEFRAAIQAARKGSSGFGLSALAYWGGMLGLVGLLIATARERKPKSLS